MHRKARALEPMLEEHRTGHRAVASHSATEGQSRIRLPDLFQQRPKHGDCLRGQRCESRVRGNLKQDGCMLAYM
eukprot:2723351-Amphidinium_carterae.1